jgi:hypothetical protein
MEFVLDLSGFEKLDKELEIIANTTIKVGVLGEDKVDSVSVQEYAIWNEYGTIYIPSRPFFRVACMSRKAQREIKAYMGKRIMDVVDGKISASVYLNAIGTFVVERIKMTIRTYPFQPNSPITLANKNTTLPLTDTGTLLRSIAFELVGDK